MHEVMLVLIVLGFCMTLFGVYWLSQQNEELRKMVQESISHLQQQIEHAATVQQSAVTLLNYLREQLEEMAQHPDAAQIKALADELRTHTDKLAAAISAHEE